MKKRAVLVLALSLAGIAAPLTMLAGADLSPWASGPRPPMQAENGDLATLDVHGWLDNGTTFLDNRSLQVVLGRGDVVAGLELAVEGLAVGDAFNVTVPPEAGYGLWNASRTTQVPLREPFDRTFQVSLRAFEYQVGPPHVGEVVQTDPWSVTVVDDANGVVTLSYNAAVGDRVQLARFWDSRVVAVDNTTITLEHLLTVGSEFSIPQRNRAPLVVRVTSLQDGNFTLDANPPLAGQTLHFAGDLTALKPGSPVRHAAGDAFSLASEDCGTCHAGAGFSALEAFVTATREGDRVRVNVSVDDPWLHALQGLKVQATLENGSLAVASGNASLPDLAESGSADASLLLPAPPGNGTVTVNVTGTAYHHHQSGGKPDSLPYELTTTVTVGAPPHPRVQSQGAAGTLATVAPLVGSVTGFAALGLAFLPAYQGWRKHKRRQPRLRWPVWLTGHFTLSLATIAVTIVHAEVLMSTTYKGSWTWDINAGVVALVAMGVLGITGVILAGWMPQRWPRARRVHYLLMLGMMALAVVHTLASSTTLRPFL